jgi:uncharacterized protein YecT (DUF1311 family)
MNSMKNTLSRFSNNLTRAALSSFLAFALLSPAPVRAQDDALGCDMADTTSAIQACIKMQLDDAQTRLNTIYSDLMKKIEDPAAQQELRDLQKLWLDYRDRECMWEARQATSGALKRLNELHCMALVTDSRAVLLEETYMDFDESVAREYITKARWVSVLNKDFPQYDWNIDDPVFGEATCDNRHELVVQGASYSPMEGIPAPVGPDGDAVEPRDADDSLLFTKRTAVAVIQNPDVGRPEISIFEFDVRENDKQGQGLCNRPITIDFMTPPEEEAEAGVDSETSPQSKAESDAQACRSTIVIRQEGCEERNIDWTGDSFILVQDSENAPTSSQASVGADQTPTN